MELVESGVIIGAEKENVNACSIDITLDDVIMIETSQEQWGIVDLKAKESVEMQPVKLSETGYHLDPGEFILASTREVFNLPNDIACEYKLKSTLARNGLDNALATWCDPGWHNSKLTLELKNNMRNHQLLLKPGMKIGQIIFYSVAPVPDRVSYKIRGQYNSQDAVTASKGLR